MNAKVCIKFPVFRLKNNIFERMKLPVDWPYRQTNHIAVFEIIQSCSAVNYVNECGKLSLEFRVVVVKRLNTFINYLLAAQTGVESFHVFDTFVVKPCR